MASSGGGTATASSPMMRILSFVSSRLGTPGKLSSVWDEFGASASTQIEGSSAPVELENAAIFSRRVWERLPITAKTPASLGPVWRTVVVVSNTLSAPPREGILLARNVQDAIRLLSTDAKIIRACIFVGKRTGNSLLQAGFCTHIAWAQLLAPEANMEALQGIRETKDSSCPHTSAPKTTAAAGRLLAFDLCKTAKLIGCGDPVSVPGSRVGYPAKPHVLLQALLFELPPAAIPLPPSLSSSLLKSVLPSVNPSEQAYLDLVRTVIEKDTKRGDRTGVGTVSTFGNVIRYSLRDGVLPLFTTKSVPFRVVAEELLWFVQGKTSAKDLQAKNVRIWDANGSRARLDALGFADREEFDLGPIYGHQWRFFGAEYKDCHADYKGQGVDQLAEAIGLLKNDPNSRRILVCAWNPTALKEMALPPCHVLFQFLVANGELSCIMYQRSCDLGLGVPFNVASYALLTHIVANICGLRPGEFVHMMADTHAYLNHIEPLKTQIARTPTAFPTLKIKRQLTSIDDWNIGDFEVVGYHPQAPIKMDMAV